MGTVTGVAIGATIVFWTVLVAIFVSKKIQNKILKIYLFEQN